MKELRDLDRIMRLAVAILAVYFFVEKGESSVPSCIYVIPNLPDSLTVDASAEPELSIYNIVVEDLAGRPSSKLTDLRDPSDYFMIQDNDVMVKSCLPVPDTSNATFSLEIQIIGEEFICPSSYLTVTVQFAVPNFSLPSGVAVDLHSCSPSDVLEVKKVQFENGDRCNITFNCFVNSTNGDKLFMYGPGDTITTTAADIDFNLTYKLNITCYDSRTSPSSVEAASVTLDVTFNNPHVCTSYVPTTSTDSTSVTLSVTIFTAFPTIQGATMSTTSSSVTTAEDETVAGFLDSATNVAIISSVGGAAAGTALGAAGALVYSNMCRSESIDITA